jgi:mRNA interferase RelE/StbE
MLPDMAYDVLIDARVKKRTRKIPRKHLEQIVQRLKELEIEPRPHDSIQLKGSLPGFRITVGEYRILYTIDFQNRMVEVYCLLNRNEGYPSHL